MGEFVMSEHATYHGRPRAFLEGDWVYVTELPRFDHRLGKVVAIRDNVNPYVVQIDLPEEGRMVNRAFDWLALTPAYTGTAERVTYSISPVDQETTGEHFFHKLGDDLYQDWADDDEPKRGWTPTPGELGLALGIMAFIILLFVFFVLFYRGW